MHTRFAVAPLLALGLALAGAPALAQVPQRPLVSVFLDGADPNATLFRVDGLNVGLHGCVGSFDTSPSMSSCRTRTSQGWRSRTHPKFHTMKSSKQPPTSATTGTSASYRSPM